MRTKDQGLFPSSDNDFIMALERDKISENKEDNNQYLVLDARLKDYIEKYVRSFRSDKQEIEVKGRLIEFIRKIK